MNKWAGESESFLMIFRGLKWIITLFRFDCFSSHLSFVLYSMLFMYKKDLRISWHSSSCFLFDKLKQRFWKKTTHIFTSFFVRTVTNVWPYVCASKCCVWTLLFPIAYITNFKLKYYFRVSGNECVHSVQIGAALGVLFDKQ